MVPPSRSGTRYGRTVDSEPSLLPNVAQLAGIEHQPLDGQGLWALLKGKKRPEMEDTVIHAWTNRVSVRSREWACIVDTTNESILPLLFNRRSDPNASLAARIEAKCWKKWQVGKEGDQLLLSQVVEISWATKSTPLAKTNWVVAWLWVNCLFGSLRILMGWVGMKSWSKTDKVVRDRWLPFIISY